MAKSAETPKSKRVGRLATGALSGVLALSGFAAASGVAGAAPSPGGLQPITDYSSYPPALPSGCPGGAGALVGLSFSNGRGATTDNLQSLPVMHGDVITMSWDDFAAGCKTADGTPQVDVALAAYKAAGPTFDLSKDEQLLPGFVGCGPNAGACQKVNGSYALSIVVPGPKVACNMQIDALLGSPLSVVGPSGSYYSNALRLSQGPSMLVNSVNFGDTNCVETLPEQTTTPTTEAPAPPAPTTTTVTMPTSTTAQPAEVSPAQASTPTTQATPTTPAAPSTEAPVQVLGIVASRQTPQTLPNTGAHNTGLMAGLAAALLGAGSVLVTQSHRLRRRTSDA